MTTKVLYGLIILTTTILTLVTVALQEYLIAVLALAVGLTWLLLEIKEKAPPASIFFLFFLGLILLATMRGLPVPLMLLALSSNLAAWDLSRFHTRIIHEEESDAKKLLELKHLQKLGITTLIGFVVALVPAFIHISINFVVFLLVILLIMLALRRSILYLRYDR